MVRKLKNISLLPIYNLHVSTERSRLFNFFHNRVDIQTRAPLVIANLHEYLYSAIYRFRARAITEWCESLTIRCPSMWGCVCLLIKMLLKFL